MSKQTALEIEQYIYNTIKTYIEENINGKLYHQNCRPLNSMEEDAIIGMLNVDANQIQNGRARIYIYCKDINNGVGRAVPNIERLTTLSKLGEPIVELLNEGSTDYLWELHEAPSMERTMTTGVAGNNKPIDQHQINIILDFERVTF